MFRTLPTRTIKYPSSFIRKLSFWAVWSILTALALSVNVYATDYHPTTGTQLQSDINSAVLGDNVILDHTVTYTVTTLSLPVKSGCSGSTFLTIESDDLASLPSGSRVQGNSNHKAKIVVTDSSGGQGIVFSGGCYKLLGLEISNDVGTSGALTNNMVDMQTTNYNTVDRSYIHPKECPNTVAPYHSSASFAVVSDGDHNTVTNSYIDCFWGLNYNDGTGGPGLNGVGFYIGTGSYFTGDNNYLGMWYNPVFIGAQDQQATSTATLSGSPTLTQATLSNTTGLSVGMNIAIQLPPSLTYCKNGLVAPCWGDGIVSNIAGSVVTYSSLVGTDYQGFNPISIPGGTVPQTPGQAQWGGLTCNHISITRNHIHIPTAFAVWLQANNHNHPKAYMEIKSLEDSLIEGNIMDGYFSLVAFNTVNQAGGSVWVKLNNVTMQHNFINGTRALIFITFDEQYYITTDGSNVNITNNLAIAPDCNEDAGDVPIVIGSGQGGSNVTVNHNTVYAPDGCYFANSISWGRLSSPHPNAGSSGMVFKDNILPNGNYGFFCNGGNTAYCWPSMTEDQNIFLLATNPPNQYMKSDQGFGNSLEAANVAAVKWTNPTGTTLADFVLQAGADGKNAATDGSDIGVNIAALSSALGPDNLADLGGGGGGPPAFTPSVKLIAICMSIIVTFLLFGAVQAILFAQSRKQIALNAPTGKYQSVIGPDRQKRLREMRDGTYQPKTRAKDYVRHED